MSDSLAGRMGGPPSGTPYGFAAQGSSANLADILERVLDKGVVIAGDIQVNLLDIELLTIKLRLLVASVDKAKEMGIDWWEHDPSLSSRAQGDAPRWQMTAGHPGGRARSDGPDPGASEQAEEIARLRAEVAELRTAALAAGESTRAKQDGAPQRARPRRAAGAGPRPGVRRRTRPAGGEGERDEPGAPADHERSEES